MPAFIADLSAAEVDARLRESLRELHAAERNSVLWFAEVMNRRLYRDLGYSSIQLYATERLQFSRSKTGYFIRLASALKTLPKLRASVARGEIAWTKAAEVARVATPRTEDRWIQEAKGSGRRDLAAKVKQARRAAEAGGSGSGDLFAAGHGTTGSAAARGTGAGATGPASEPTSARSAVTSGGVSADSGSIPGRAPEGSESTRIPASPGSGSTPDRAPAVSASAETGPESATVVSPALPTGAPASLPHALPAAASEVRLRFTPEQRAHYEAMVEKLRKLGEKGPVAEIVLEAMTRLVGERSQATRSTARARSDSGEHAAGPNPDRSAPVASRLATGNPDCGNEAAVPVAVVQNPSSPVYQVYVRTCEECDRGWVEGRNGPEPLDTATLRAILCDARISRPGEPNRHQVPPRLRRATLERDGYRCRVRGCASHRFLNVHHVTPRAKGGRNHLAGLVTLCAPCHRLLHAQEGHSAALQPVIRTGSRGKPAACP